MARYFILSGETAAGKLFAEAGRELAPLKSILNDVRAANGKRGSQSLRRLQLQDDSGYIFAQATFHTSPIVTTPAAPAGAPAAPATPPPAVDPGAAPAATTATTAAPATPVPAQASPDPAPSAPTSSTPAVKSKGKKKP